MVEFCKDAFDSHMLECVCCKLWLYEQVKTEDIATHIEPVADAAPDFVACFSVYSRANFQALQRLGFQLISVRNTYARRLDGLDAGKSLPGLALATQAPRRVQPEDLAPLATVIGETSRYFKDERLSRAACQRVYETWLANSLFHGNAVDSVLAFKGDTLAGIHTVKMKANIGVVDLIGVLPELQHDGLGTALLLAGARVMRERGARDIEVVTENENVPACRFYQKLGFRLSSVQFVWHWHR